MDDRIRKLVYRHHTRAGHQVRAFLERTHPGGSTITATVVFEHGGDPRDGGPMADGFVKFLEETPDATFTLTTFEGGETVELTRDDGHYWGLR